MSSQIEDVNHALPNRNFAGLRHSAPPRLDFRILGNAHRLNKRCRAAVLCFDGALQFVQIDFGHPSINDTKEEPRSTWEGYRCGVLRPMESQKRPR